MSICCCTANLRSCITYHWGALRMSLTIRSHMKYWWSSIGTIGREIISNLSLNRIKSLPITAAGACGSCHLDHFFNDRRIRHRLFRRTAWVFNLSSIRWESEGLREVCYLTTYPSNLSLRGVIRVVAPISRCEIGGNLLSVQVRWYWSTKAIQLTVHIASLVWCSLDCALSIWKLNLHIALKLRWISLKIGAIGAQVLRFFFWGCCWYLLLYWGRFKRWLDWAS